MNNLTAYRSPIKLLALNAEEIAVFSEATITQAKQKLYSHIPENEETEVALNNINAFTWPFHKYIFDQAGLLQFLEEGKFEDAAMQKASFLRYNPAFVQFVSAPFALAFQKASAAMLQEKEVYPSLLKLMTYASFILPQHEAFAFQPIRQYLQLHFQTLASLSWEQFIRDENQLGFVFTNEWISIINCLPAVCTPERDEMIKVLLQIMKRFRLDASPDYLKVFCAHLHQLRMEPAVKEELEEYQDSFHLPRTVKKAAPTSVKRRWPFYAGGAIVFMLATIVLLSKPEAKKNRRPELPEDKFMEAVESTTASDQLNSSVNERNLKGFFFLSGRQENIGEPKLLNTGMTPLPGVTKLPAGNGNSTLVIRNQTAADALLFYFGSDNPLVNEDSRLVAVYIRRGEEYRCRFQPDFGRFNVLFGKNWVKMNTPVPFPIQTNNTNKNSLTALGSNQQEMWIIPEFFRNVSPHQPYLTHDLLITNVQQQTISTSNNLVYTLLNEKDKKKLYSDEGYAQITLQ
ncbi:MAG: hypothetical protein M3Q06_12475, partial [Bacteroidota bacterium]|nr:hypothetical protein [Bacteroidota bacterium]